MKILGSVWSRWGDRRQHGLRCFTGGEAQNTGAAEDHTGASLAGWSSGEEMENEVSLHPRTFAFMFDIQCMQQADFLSLFSLEEKKITFLENVACRVKHVLLLQRTGRSPSTSVVHRGVLGYDKGCRG